MAQGIVMPSLQMGCDPEMFFEKGGKIIGAEKVIPHKGQVRAFVLDGVQIELNPHPNTCRALLGNDIRAHFKGLREHLLKMDGVRVSFNSVVKLSKKELDSLSDKAKVFGCAPSLNQYDAKAKIRVNPKRYLKRSAGGHIHLGLTMDANLFKERKRLVPIMDVIVGNTCVMIDRDPEAVERRKVYGRAGEYRLPPHGLEYRTLSNFWLRSYPLMGLVMGLSRLATGVLKTTLMEGDRYRGIGNGWNAEKDLLDRVDLSLIRTAINENDLELAKSNFEGVRGFVEAHVPAGGWYGIGGGTQMVNFLHFLKKIEEKGIEYWFKEDPLEHWCGMGDGHDSGIEWFLSTTVNADRKKG